MVFDESGKQSAAGDTPWVAAPVWAALWVACVLLAVFGIYAPTVASMAAVWSSSATFTHGYLVLPICLWLTWQRRAQLAQTPLLSVPLALVLVAAGGFAWLLGNLSSSLSVAHFSLVGMAAATVFAVFGRQWTRTLALPLAFLLFAVPFGEVLIPNLIDWTADFTVTMLRLSRVPVLRDGNDLTIPSGRWSVIETCSGVRYLIASLMIGTLYAWAIYRSTTRRALFIAASIATPIVANWLRAYGIVMLGHLSNNEIATGVDHLIYGWVFFGVVNFALFAVGMHWREDETVLTAQPLPRACFTAPRASNVIATAVVLAIWPLMEHFMNAARDQRPVDPIAVVAPTHWRAVDEAVQDWRPRLAGPRLTLLHSFERDGQRVSFHAGIFRGQVQGEELVNSQHRLVPVAPEGWRLISNVLAQPRGAAGVTAVRSIVLRSPSGGYLRVWHCYWLGGRWTANDAVAKADLAVNRLLLRSDTSAWVAFATAHDPERPQQSNQTLEAFLTPFGPSLDAALLRAVAPLANH